jgi:L-ascorbate metabolism protein UlaG (beta-lactamase superfamily)
MEAAANPAGLTAQWFGVTTLLISDGETGIMIDGFLSRPSWRRVVFRKLEPDLGHVRTVLKDAKVDAVFVSHAHYDHALDAPAVATEKQAMLLGAESVLHIARAAGMTRERLCAITHGDRITIGKFDIQAFRSPHSPTFIHGAIDESFEVPAHALDYKLGVNFSFLLRHPAGDVLVVPSANSVKGMLAGTTADIVFLGIGQLGKRDDQSIRDYWAEAVEERGARLVIPVHWDNFMQPFEAPLQPFPAPFDNVERALDRLAGHSQAHKIPVMLMPLATRVALPRTEHPLTASPARAACPGS